MSAPDIHIAVNASIEPISTYGNKDYKGIRLYKYSPDRILLQVWGKRANTPMQANALLTKEELIQLRDAAISLLEYLP